MELSKSLIRLITGLIIGFTAFFAIMFGGIYLSLLLLIIVVLSAKEYTIILQHKGFLPSYKIIIISSVLFTAMAYFEKLELLPFIISLSVIIAFMWVLFRGKQPYIANVATTILGSLYCGWFPLHLLFIRDIGNYSTFNGFIKYSSSTDGAIYALMLLLSVIITDTMCYYFGSRYGKHKLSAVISPNKTIEGSIGGTLSCIIFCLMFGYAISMPLIHCLIIGILIALFAQIGDLCESMIKRDAGVKDSSNILPGHGGFLDRTDSFVLTAPIFYYYLYFFVQNDFLEIIKGLF